MKVRLRPISLFLLVSGAILLGASLLPGNPLYRVNWAVLSTVVAVIALLVLYHGMEQEPVKPQEVALIATLSSVAAAGRVVLAGLASVQPATFIIMISGYVYGTRIGFMVGSITALVSNFFLGQGPWTPWQMICWGLCGILGALLGRNQAHFQRIRFTILAGMCGYLFSWMINLWYWLAFIYPLTVKTLFTVFAGSFLFDTFHAASNVAFSLILGPSFYSILLRYKRYL